MSHPPPSALPPSLSSSHFQSQSGSSPLARDSHTRAHLRVCWRACYCRFLGLPRRHLHFQLVPRCYWSSRLPSTPPWRLRRHSVGHQAGISNKRCLSGVSSGSPEDGLVTTQGLPGGAHSVSLGHERELPAFPGPDSNRGHVKVRGHPLDLMV